MTGNALPEGGRGPVLITGANGTLTSAIVRALAASHPLLLHVHRRTDRLEDLQGTDHVVLQSDLSTAEGVRALATRVRYAVPRLTGMVLGASLFEPTPATASPDAFSEVLRRTLGLNLAAPLELVQRLHGLIEDRGRIVFLTDAGARAGWPSYAAYVAARAGLEAAVRSLARALGPRLTVLAIAPGVVEGSVPFPQRLASHGTALGRAGTPEEVARAFLGAWRLPEAVVHGAVLTVDGGLDARLS